MWITSHPSPSLTTPRQARLVILLGPPASAFGGVALGVGFDFLIVDGLLRLLGYAAEEEEEPGGKTSPTPALDVAAREEPKEALKDAPQGGNGGAGLLKSKPKPSQLAAAAKAHTAIEGERGGERGREGY